MLHNLLLRVKTFLASWANCVQLFSKSQTTVFSEIGGGVVCEKNSTLNIKDPISLFKDTWRLLLSSHKHAVSQKQIESSSVLTEAACGAEKYQREETCSILSTLTQNTKRMLDRLLQDGKLDSVWLGKSAVNVDYWRLYSDCSSRKGEWNLLHEWPQSNLIMTRCLSEYVIAIDKSFKINFLIKYTTLQ